MPPRLSSHSLSTFIAFNSCARQNFTIQHRNVSVYRSKRLPLKPTSPTYKQISHKRQIHSTRPCSASSKNPYDVLGVKKDATPAEIKKTYFALARKYHPDTNKDKGARDKFVEIQDAYDILKDEQKRAQYDQFGSASQSPGFDPNAFAHGAGGFSGFSGFSGFGFPSSGWAAGGRAGSRKQADLFEELFGAFAAGGPRGRAEQNMRGEDIDLQMSIDFLEACKGAKKKVTITPVVDCKPCSSSGLKPGAKKTTCAACRGTGTRTFVIESGFQMASTCDACHGQGSTASKGDQCPTCDGVGKVRSKEQLTVDIPMGAEEGTTIRIPKAGNAPLSGSGPRGDLFIRLDVAPSSVFQRQGANLFYQARIPFHRALLGGVVKVPTLDDSVNVRIPGGTQQGEEMVLKGRGVSYMHGNGSGDLFVKFHLQLPRTLTPKQRSLLQAYAADVEGKLSPDQKDKNSKETLSSDNGTTSSEKEETDLDTKEKGQGKRATG